jgi:hypothetical protein
MLDLLFGFSRIWQMNLFLDHLWIWIILTFIVGVCSYVWFLNAPKGHNFIIAIAIPFLTLVIGLALYYGVDTDRKSVVRTLNALIAAVEQDDYETVSQYIAPRADNVRQIAERGMRTIRISRARYNRLEIEINDATSPPSAKVRFTAFFYWDNKEPIEGMTLNQPISDTARFEFEMVKTQSSSPAWHITNRFEHRFRYSFP